MSLSLTYRHEAMPLREPFRISGYLFEAFPAIVATISDGSNAGRGEAAGVYFMNDDPAHMQSEIDRCRSEIEGGATRQELRGILPAGGARNALDCALWELESLQKQRPVWQLAGVPAPKALVTTFTLPADDPAEIERKMGQLLGARSLKLKLEGDLAADAERIRTVRKFRPDVWLAVDANQGFGAGDLDALAKILVEADVALLEQPIPRGSEHELDGWKSPIPIAGDESILDLDELLEHARRFDVINIKLDKCGGLTEALLMAKEAKRLGKQVMVGNMAGSTLAAAPGFILGQLCDVVDLDGPYFLADDPLASRIFLEGRVSVATDMWGAAEPLSVPA